MRSVAISLDGVLRKPLDVEAQDMGGTLLYLGLVQQFRVVVLGTEDVERDKQWMLLQGLTGYVKIEPVKPGDNTSNTMSWERDKIENQLKRLRSEGFVFEFVVLPEPELALDLLRDGFPVLLYAHPRFSPPEVKGITPWNQLDSQVRATRQARAEAAAQ